MRDPTLRVMVLITAVGCALVITTTGHLQVQSFWVFQPPLDAVLAIGAWRVRRVAPAHLRRFWLVLTFSGTSFTLGDTYQCVRSFWEPGSVGIAGTTVQSSFFVVGMSSTVIACLIFPQGKRSPREQLIYWLDATTALVGSAVVAWCFAVNPLQGSDTDVVAGSITAALVLVAAFAATRVALVAAPPMTRIAAWPMVSAAGVQSIAAFLPIDPDGSNAGYVHALRLVPSLLIAVGPRIQEIVVRIDPTRGERPRRPYSLLPYIMVGVTFCIFFAMLPAAVSSQLWGAIAGVVVITCVVAARQLVSFQDNVLLIKRLDNALAEVRGHETLLREQASFDGLTKLANRTHFGDLTSEALNGLRSSDTMALLLIDLDDFKTVNDTMGHPAGDVLLVTVAARLRTAVRDGDVVARLGGDEFAVLLRLADAETAGTTAQRILELLAEPIEVAQHHLIMRASIGVAIAAPGDDLSELLSNADIAMYEAKNRGKSTWVQFDLEMGTRIALHAALIRELQHAVDAGEFFLEYQPIVRFDTGHLVSAEVLIRWRHPTRGLVPPVDFIPVAEQSGLIVPIGRWVLQQACRQVTDWHRRHPGMSDLTISVNVAGRQLRALDFLDDVVTILAETGLRADCLTIEVTETAVFDDDHSIATLHALRALGVKIALDDFGTAASSLGLLLTCPVTALKLDRSFVEAVTTVTRQAAVAAAVIQMANALKLSCVAEGVETTDQALLLQDLGYEYGQGYLFSPPLPIDQFDARLAGTFTGHLVT